MVASAVTSSRVQVTVSDPAFPSKFSLCTTGSLLFPAWRVRWSPDRTCLVVLLKYMDNSVKPDSDFQDLTGTAVLAIVATIPNLRAGGHQVYTG